MIPFTKNPNVILVHLRRGGGRQPAGTVGWNGPGAEIPCTQRRARRCHTAIGQGTEDQPCQGGRSVRRRCASLTSCRPMATRCLGPRLSVATAALWGPTGKARADDQRPQLGCPTRGRKTGSDMRAGGGPNSGMDRVDRLLAGRGQKKLL